MGPPTKDPPDWKKGSQEGQKGEKRKGEKQRKGRDTKNNERGRRRGTQKSTVAPPGRGSRGVLSFGKLHPTRCGNHELPSITHSIITFNK